MIETMTLRRMGLLDKTRVSLMLNREGLSSNLAIEANSLRLQVYPETQRMFAFLT